MPEIAGVGLTEAQAREHGDVKVGKFPMLAKRRAKTNHEPERLREGHRRRQDRLRPRRLDDCFSCRDDDRSLRQAMEFGATSEDIAYTCHAHPTHSEALKEAAMAVTGKPIHI